MNDYGTMYAIGLPHPFGDKLKEGASIYYDNCCGFTVEIKLPNLTPQAITAFRKGTISIDLSYLEKILFFTIDIDNFTYFDLAFTSNITYLNSKDELGDIENNEGFAFNFILTEATNNIVQALRVISLSNHFSKILLEKMKEQLDENFNANEHNRKVFKIFSKYNDLKQLSIAHTKSTNSI